MFPTKHCFEIYNNKSFKRKQSFISLSSLACGNFFRCVRARAHLRAHDNDAKIVRSRDAQYNAEESPVPLKHLTLIIIISILVTGNSIYDQPN